MWDEGGGRRHIFITFYTFLHLTCMCNNEENVTFISNHVNGTRYLILFISFFFLVLYLKFSNTSIMVLKLPCESNSFLGKRTNT